MPVITRAQLDAIAVGKTCLAFCREDGTWSAYRMVTDVIVRTCIFERAVVRGFVQATPRCKLSFSITEGYNNDIKIMEHPYGEERPQH